MLLNIKISSKNKNLFSVRTEFYMESDHEYELE